MNWRDFQRLQKVTPLGDRFISYVDKGSGSPVLLIHGIPTWGYLWHGLLPLLATKNRVLIPDMPGFGYSDKADNFDRSIAVQAMMLDAWMEKMQIRKATVVGHDIGGGVALRLATLFPDRVNRLCVMDSVCYDSWPIELMLQFGHPEANRKLSASAAITLLRQALRKGLSAAADDMIIDGLLAPYHTEVGKLSLIRNAAALNTNLTTEITGRLGEINVPVLILWGEDDSFQLIEYGERLVRDITGARMVRIANASHFLMLDQPGEVGGELFRWLSSDAD